MNATYRFDDFTLDPDQRQLRRGDALLEVNTRYLDALTLLVRNQGRLVSKDQFLAEVWRGIPVTEEALTQCIRALRRQLGDNVASPRYIETVPKHGYRFIAEVAAAGVPTPSPTAALSRPAAQNEAAPYGLRQCLLLALFGTTGAGLAGVFGGLFYGFVSVLHPLEGVGAISRVLVLVCLNVIIGLTAGAGVSFGIAASSLLPGGRWRWSIPGGAAGGLVVGALVKLVGLDAFNLLLGQSPGDITGGFEGLLLGGAVGFGIWFGSRGAATPWNRRAVIAAGLAGGVVGALLPLLGGRLMGGSLYLLGRSFPHSHLRVDQIGAVFGEQGFGAVSGAVTGCIEGALFGACITAAMVLWSPLLARRAPAIGSDLVSA